MKPYTQHGSQIWRHTRLVAQIPHDGSVPGINAAIAEAEEIINQLNAVAILKSTLQPIADGQIMSGVNTYAETVLAYQEAARNALKQAGLHD